MIIRDSIGMIDEEEQKNSDMLFDLLFGDED
jgi:hypothetical protein